MENKNLKIENSEVKEKEFKSYKDYSKEDIEKLDKYSVTITANVKVENDDVIVRNPILKVKLNDWCVLTLQNQFNMQNQNKAVRPVTPEEFNLLKLLLKKGLKVNALSLKSPVRLVKGVSADNKEYYRVDILLTRSIIKTIWLKKTDLEILKESKFDLSKFEEGSKVEISSSDIEDNVLFE